MKLMHKTISIFPISIIRTCLNSLLILKMPHSNSFQVKEAYYKPIKRLFHIEHTHKAQNRDITCITNSHSKILTLLLHPYSTKNMGHYYSLHFRSVKKLLTDGIISGALLRTNFLRVCSAYFSPSAKFSKTPADLFSLLTLF